MRVTADEYHDHAIIRVDGQPVLLAEFNAKWRINHSIHYLERQPRLASDIYDEMGFMVELSLGPILKRLEELVEFYD